MIADLKPYPAYKDSGVPWLGEVPEYWDMQRGKWIFSYKKEPNTNGFNTNVLSLTLRGVVNNNPGDPEGLVPKDYATYQLFRKNDLVFKLIDLENLRTSRVGLVHEDGIMSPAYIRLSAKSDTNIQFFYQQFFDLYERGIYNQLGAGVRSTLGPTDLLNLPILVPGTIEQNSIVRFLNYADRRIRRYIRAKQKLIKLLEEQKQVIIHRAVTRGLDPNIRLKPSGVEWLGDIPEHWDVRKLKRIARLNPSRTESSHLRDLNKLATFLPMERVSTRGEVDSSLQLPIRDLWQGFTYFRQGDVLLAKITPCFENGKGACLTTLPTEIGFGTTEFIVLRAGKLIQPEFLYQLIHLAIFRDMGIESMTGSAGQQRVSFDFVANFVLPVPPVKEQKTILKRIEESTKQIESGISRALQEISLLKEYRTRLIADVVTGKLDVRDAAASLPDEIETPDIPDDELMDENETAGDDSASVTEESEM
jgi:type I restriction enzyme S subunit